MAIKHSFTSAIADDPAASAAGEVLPSHWNAGHVLDALTFATLPASPTAGEIAYFTDGTAAQAWGAIAAGAGATPYLVWYDGSNWRIFAKGAGPAGPYSTGPGDIVSGARYWCGLRGYTGAIASGGITNAIKLRRDSDDATMDFVILPTGGVDVASITTFKGADNLFVDTFYDQTGNGNDFVQATHASQPGFDLTGLNAKPAVTFNGSQFLATSSGAVTNPFTTSVLAKRELAGRGAINEIWWLTGAVESQLAFDAANNTVYFGNSDITATALDASWHGLIGIFNLASSSFNVDGTETTGSNSFSGTTSGSQLGTIVGSFFLTGSVAEFGVWSSVAFTPTNQTDLYNNQVDYWNL